MKPTHIQLEGLIERKSAKQSEIIGQGMVLSFICSDTYKQLTSNPEVAEKLWSLHNVAQQ